MPCAGDPLVTCGAGFRIEVYNITGYVPVVKGPASLPEAPYLGCFEDSGSRVLPGRALTSPSMTAAVCAEHCAGFKYFGTEFGSECKSASDSSHIPCLEAFFIYSC